MIIDHVTYEVPVGALAGTELSYFFTDILGMKEVPPDHAIEKNWNVRWWEDDDNFQIHLVEPGLDAPVGVNPILLGLGHFCIVVDEKHFKAATECRFLERNSGSGRIWLCGPCGIRVEVRPQSMGGEGSKMMNYQRWDVPPEAFEQSKVLDEALNIYMLRNDKYKDNWRRFGLKGCLFRIRERAERAWDHLMGWDGESYQSGDEDDLIDMINFCAFAIRAIREKNTGGTWYG